MSDPPRIVGTAGSVPPEVIAAEQQWRAYQRVWAAFVLLLVIVSWRLWIPQQVFPQVPVFAWLRGLSGAADGGLLAVLILSLAGAAVFVRRGLLRSVALGGFLVSMLGLILLDQHRLQAWAYQGLVIAILLWGTPSRLGISLLRVFAVSVYFYSAAGKLDFQFLHTVGQQFLETAAGWGNVRLDDWPMSTRVRIAWLLPITEGLLALAALVPWTRRWAGWGLAGMHLTLTALLGPWGLGHQPGVLAWNAFFMAQAIVLFAGIYPGKTASRPEESLADRSCLPGWWRSFGLPLFFFAVLTLPLTERFGIWDHWPSWALYSPHSSRVELAIHASRVERVPSSLRPYLESDRTQAGWHRLAMDRWSIESLGVPVYPQARFQLGVAIAALEQAEAGEAVRLRLRGVADRWTGRREQAFYGGPEEIERATEAYWLNAKPRRRWNLRKGDDLRKGHGPLRSRFLRRLDVV